MSSEITILLERYREGDGAAIDELARLIYPELKAMARRRSRNDLKLGATTLVNETFLKLLSGGMLRPADRQQFFGLAATIMRQVIVDEVRYVSAAKRSADEVTFSDTRQPDESREKAEFLLQVDRILDQLLAENPMLAKVFECRYFAGFTTAETAEALSTSERSVERFWAEARERIAALMSDTTR